MTGTLILQTIRPAALSLMICLCAHSSWAVDPQWDFEPQPMARIPGGVVVGNESVAWLVASRAFRAWPVV